MEAIRGGDCLINGVVSVNLAASKCRLILCARCQRSLRVALAAQFGPLGEFFPGVPKFSASAEHEPGIGATVGGVAVFSGQ